MIPRYGLSLGVALAITSGLLFLMQLLIASDQATIEARHDIRWLDFVRVARQQIVETKRDKPEKPPEPAEPPELPRTTTSDPTGAGLAVTMTAPDLTGGADPKSLGTGLSDGEYLPFVKVVPVYPPRAQAGGVEGYAIVEYTVTAVGTTRDIRLVESSSSLFDRSCIDAAAKFKYRPRQVNGDAIEVPGVRNRCTYRLND